MKKIMLGMTEILTELFLSKKKKPVKEIGSIHLKTLVCKLNLQKWMNVSNLWHMNIKEITAIFHMYQTLCHAFGLSKVIINNFFCKTCDMAFYNWLFGINRKKVILGYYLMILSTRILSIWEVENDFGVCFLIKETVVSLRYMDDTQLSCRSINIVNVRPVK